MHLAMNLHTRRRALLLLAACAIAVVLAVLYRKFVRSTPRVIVVAQVDAAAGLDVGTVTWAPTGAILSATRVSATEVALECDPRALSGKLHLEIAGACPVDLSLEDARPGEERRIALTPWIDLGDGLAQAGFDAAFELKVHAGCTQATVGRITWRQIEGPPLASMTEDENGFVLRARTLPLAQTLPEPRPWGIVPVSPRTRAEHVLEASWFGDGANVRRVVRVASAARATGVPSLALGQRVMLGGNDWRVRERPREGSANVVVSGGVATFEADASGRWVLEDGAGRPLALRAGLYDRAPLDCGRSDCHARAAADAAVSPMTHVLERGLEGAFGPTYDLRCTLPCHAVGEPGLRDGGFAQIARELGFALIVSPGAGRWGELPRPLRRLGGVGCTSCHGPAAIPEKDARWSILRSDVCATCHDAPPRYGHVLAWSRSRMARADAIPQTRANARCATCHTTSGFLASIGVRSAPEETPAGVGPIGIGCAACHAPHGAHEGGALLRRVPERRTLDSQRDLAASRICIGCHSPLGARGAGDATADASETPPASAAALWLGRRAAPSEEDAAGAPAPHAIVGSCVGCHAGAQGDTLRGASHSFAANADRCRRCHASAPRERPGPTGLLVQGRAAALLARLSSCGVVTKSAPIEGGPPHANDGLRIGGPRPLRRAAWNTLLVLEDPAAGAHNAPFARALLDEAESLANSSCAAGPRRPE
jgi:hypothetical protein